VLRLRLRPQGEAADDFVAEQHHQMIAFSKDDQARWRANSTDDVRDSIGVTSE
jgi:hypothetical protein